MILRLGTTEEAEMRALFRKEAASMELYGRELSFSQIGHATLTRQVALGERRSLVGILTSNKAWCRTLF